MMLDVMVGGYTLDFGGFFCRKKRHLDTMGILTKGIGGAISMLKSGNTD
jgi:hypothetical protein